MNSSLQVTEWKMPGYTGYLHGLTETFGQTPLPAQLEAKFPPAESFLHSRGEAPNRDQPSADPCNDFQKPGHTPVDLWPASQTAGKQPSAKPPTSALALGDTRINPFVSTYQCVYKAPFNSGDIRSPLCNVALQHAVDLREIYNSASLRVGEKRLKDMIAHIRERIAGKIGNASDNAFRLRKLFKHWDYDLEATGEIEYHKLMQTLVDSDNYALYQANHAKHNGEGCGSSKAQQSRAHKRGTV